MVSVAWSTSRSLVLGSALVLVGCGGNPEVISAASGSGSPTLRAATETSAAAPDVGVGEKPAIDPQDAPTGSTTTLTLPFRTDVEVISGPVTPEVSDVEPVVRLIDRDGVPAIEVTLLKVPEGTNWVEFEVNGRVQALTTYVPGSVTVMRVPFDTDFEIVVVAKSSIEIEIARSESQLLSRYRSGDAEGGQ